MSSEDIPKGTRWSGELGTQLEQTRVGVICVDPSNSVSPWLNFEAGALSRSVDDALVIPFLFRMKPTELSGPLSQFQVTDSASKEDVGRMIATLAERTDVPRGRAAKTFEFCWPGLTQALAALPNPTTIQPEQTSKPTQEPRAPALPERIRPLVYLANRDKAFPSDIAKSTNIPLKKLEVILGEWQNQGFVYWGSSNRCWYLQDDGTQYLIREKYI